MSAIGQPKIFFDNLRKAYDVSQTIVFDDHHSYSESDIPKTDLPIITTEKDAVKLKNFNINNIYALKLKAVIDMEKLLNN